MPFFWNNEGLKIKKNDNPDAEMKHMSILRQLEEVITFWWNTFLVENTNSLELHILWKSAWSHKFFLGGGMEFNFIRTEVSFYILSYFIYQLEYKWPAKILILISITKTKLDTIPNANYQLEYQ